MTAEKTFALIKSSVSKTTDAPHCIPHILHLNHIFYHGNLVLDPSTRNNETPAHSNENLLRSVCGYMAIYYGAKHIPADPAALFHPFLIAAYLRSHTDTQKPQNSFFDWLRSIPFEIPDLTRLPDLSNPDFLADFEHPLTKLAPESLNPETIRKTIIERMKTPITIDFATTLSLTHNQAETLYEEHSGQSHFPRLVESVTSSPVTLMILSGPNCISTWRKMIGPTIPQTARQNSPFSLRARFAEKDLPNNAFHGSSDHIEAKREISLFEKII